MQFFVSVMEINLACTRLSLRVGTLRKQAKRIGRVPSALFSHQFSLSVHIRELK